MDHHTPPGGLTSEDARRLLHEFGPNALPGTQPRSLWVLAFDVLREPMLLLLLVAAAIYVVLGELRDAIALSVSSIIVIGISIAQAQRTEQALAKLKALSSPQALVMRDGVERRVSGLDVVPGDLIVLQEGDRVPADADIVRSSELTVDESILTGESLAIDKTAPESGPVDTSRSSAVYSGTLILAGHGIARVIATGERSELGRIGKALDSLTPEPTRLMREMRRIVAISAGVAVCLCVSLAMLYGWMRADWLGGLLAGIALAMGLLPEEFPVVLTITLALGARRLSRENVLIRRLPALETIGAVTVLGVDKTGTLTENRMRVVLLESAACTADLRRSDLLDASTRDILATALAASEIAPFDRMERAIHEAAASLMPERVMALAQEELVREYELSSSLLAVTHVWRTPGTRGHIVAVKGAPETVFRLCALPDMQSQAQLRRVAALATEGLRVLAVASGSWVATDFPESPASFQLRLLGLLCFADPLRTDVPDALSECDRAGIRVIMITGDHPGTAAAIARQAGFTAADRVVTGEQLRVLDGDALQRCVRATSVFARMTPDDKLRLVQQLQAMGETVAMTGDGVNDAPALKAAHVGVAMGSRGSDVAREAAAIVLVNDDFASLAHAVKSGRRIFDNLQHAMVFIVAVHIPIAGMGLLPALLGWPLLLLPLHILFMEFIIDPACSLVFEADPPAADLMRRRPRRADAPLLSKEVFKRGALLGFTVLLMVFALYAVGIAMGSATQARTVAYVGLIAANLTLILVVRRTGTAGHSVAPPNPTYWGLVAVAVIVLTGIVYLPPVAAAFQLSRLPFGLFIAIIGLSVAGVVSANRLLQRLAAAA